MIMSNIKTPSEIYKRIIVRESESGINELLSEPVILMAMEEYAAQFKQAAPALPEDAVKQIEKAIRFAFYEDESQVEDDFDFQHAMNQILPAIQEYVAGKVYNKEFEVKLSHDEFATCKKHYEEYLIKSKNELAAKDAEIKALKERLATVEDQYKTLNEVYSQTCKEYGIMRNLLEGTKSTPVWIKITEDSIPKSYYVLKQTDDSGSRYKGYVSEDYLIARLNNGDTFHYLYESEILPYLPKNVWEYNKDQVKSWFFSNGYHETVAEDLSQWISDNMNAAYQKGKIHGSQQLEAKGPVWVKASESLPESGKIVSLMNAYLRNRLNKMPFDPTFIYELTDSEIYYGPSMMRFPMDIIDWLDESGTIPQPPRELPDVKAEALLFADWVGKNKFLYFPNLGWAKETDTATEGGFKSTWRLYNDYLQQKQQSNG